jgi:long-chain acyl-CoA synthetase
MHDPALTRQALPERCRQHRSGDKAPKIVEFRSEPLPKSNLGKVVRGQLRDAHAAARTASAADTPAP